MSIRRHSLTHSIDVPEPMIDLAKRRTEGLFRQMQYGDMPMRMVLASAYMQGMHDMFQTFENHPAACVALTAAHGGEK